jgi:hypothetical protein
MAIVRGAGKGGHFPDNSADLSHKSFSRKPVLEGLYTVSATHI